MAYTHMTTKEEDAYKELVSMIESEVACLSIDHEYHKLYEHEGVAIKLSEEFTRHTHLKQKCNIQKQIKIFSCVNIILCISLPLLFILSVFNERTK